MSDGALTLESAFHVVIHKGAGFHLVIHRGAGVHVEQVKVPKWDLFFL